MKTDFELLDRNASDRRVTVTVDGSEFQMREGENLAAELLCAGITVFRKTPVSGAPRGPFCMMGACYDCLVGCEGEVEQACQMTVFDGLKVESVGSHGVDQGTTVSQESSQ